MCEITFDRGVFFVFGKLALGFFFAVTDDEAETLEEFDIFWCSSMGHGTFTGVFDLQLRQLR